MNVDRTLEDLYVSIAGQIQNPRQLESLSRVKQACDYLATNRVKVTPTTVERYCLDRGWDGPKAQSIRNSHDVLARYLRARCAGQAVPRAAVEREREPAIHDESIRAYVMLLQQERDQAVSARTRIEKALRTIPGVPADDLIRAGFAKADEGAVVQAKKSLSPAAIQAIQSLFNPETLEQCGLELYKDRIRQSATRNVLLESVSVKALRDILAEIHCEPARSI